MDKSTEIRFSLVLSISGFLHLIAFITLIIPNFHSITNTESAIKRALFKGRDIIVNINQDDLSVLNRKTLLSDRDSSAKGHITKKRGDRWLNNSLDFQLLKGESGTGRLEKFKPVKVHNVLLNSNTEVVVFLRKFIPKKGESGNKGKTIKIKIPDKIDVTFKNAIYYSNTGKFSYNTAKFKNFQYFKGMKDKISSNWNLPGMANLAFGGYNPVTGNYSTARGWERYLTIPSQMVKLYFTMNREGEVIDVKITDSMGNKQLDISCIEAIRLSKNFGPVPDDISGEVIVIPFIFGFYTR